MSNVCTFRMKHSAVHYQLGILLWHHFRYYKRHWIKLLLTILQPFIYLIPTYYLILVLVDGQVLDLAHFPPCQHETVSPISAGPLQFFDYVGCGNDSNCMVEPFDSTYLDRHLQGATNCRRNDFYGCSSTNFTQCRDSSGDSSYRGFDMHDCTLMKGYILYYPSGNATDAVMEQVSRMIDTHVSVMQNLPSKANATLPSLSLQQTLELASLYKTCAAPAAGRVRGFPSRQDALNFVQDMVSAKNWSVDDFRSTVTLLWGIVGFDNVISNVTILPKHVQYRILYDSSYHTPNVKIVSLQDLVEYGVLKTQSKNKTLPLSLVWKSLPNKCWNVPQEIVFTLLLYFIPAIAVFSFLPVSANFLEQVLTEKWLRLREFMYIMGVGSFTLKISWIVFYLLFLLPLSIIVAIFVAYMPGGVFAHSDPSLIFLLLIMYNISQLSFCYFLATWLQTPRRTGILITFLNGFMWILGAFLFSNLSNFGFKLVIVRLLSLYPVIPFMLCFCYLVTWESWWDGARWGNFFYSPLLQDQYGGFGECLLWLLFDTALYLILAWYLERVRPGEYGVKQPFYFFLLPSYWCPERASTRKSQVLITVDEADVEEDGSIAAQAGIVLESLTKAYTADKIGVSHLNLTFNRNEVTAFLGQNGAGKSTTLNLLVGLISPSEGSATVHGYNIRNQMDNIRKILGFVPQYDILYPSMTVEEHLQFFGWLKGYSKAEMWPTVDPLLDKLGIADRKQVITSNLSGGQKRKLSILTAYLGNPQVIILDEPTSGVDPLSRRAIWDLISSLRRSATTILSTHNMQEADLLGDRIAIISNGQLRANGTPMYLKNRYGKGFRLFVAVQPHGSTEELMMRKENIKRYILTTVSQSSLLDESGSDLLFAVPLEVAQSGEVMIQTLEKLEKEQSQLGIASYGLSEPTMEEVFFKAADVDNQSSRTPHSEVENEEENRNAVVHDNEILSTQLQYTKGGYSWPLTQFWAFFAKRFWYSMRSVSGFLLQLCLPLAFIILLLLIGNQALSDLSGVERPVHVYARYRDNVLFYQDLKPSGDVAELYVDTAVKYGLGPRCPAGTPSFSCSGNGMATPKSLTDDPGAVNATGLCDSCSTYCDWPANANKLGSATLASTDKLYNFGTKNNVTDWLIHLNRTSGIFVGGFQFHKLPEITLQDTIRKIGSMAPSTDLGARLNVSTNPNYVVVWTKAELQMGMVNVFNNLMLRSMTNSDEYTISLTIESIRMLPTYTSGMQAITQALVTMVSSFFLTLAFGFSLVGTAVFIGYENSSGLKRLQFMAGGNKTIYWIVNLLWDYLLFVITTCVIFLLLGTVPNYYKPYVNLIAMVILPYGFMTLTFTYFVSLFVKGSAGIIKTQVISIFVILFVASSLSGLSMAQQVCENEPRSTRECSFAWAKPLNTIFCLYPFYLLSDAMLVLATFVALPAGNPSRITADNIVGLDFLGRHVVIAIVMGTVYFIMTLILEHLDVQFEFNCRCSCCKSANRTGHSTSYIPITDPDVRLEADRINASTTSGHEPVVVRTLAKDYNGLPAVNGVSFGIPRGQCFGLLGINGAGKTTLFRMLTGFLKPTSGTAQLLGFDVFRERRRAQSLMNYCPQENILFDQLTAGQHLWLFALLHKIPQRRAKDLVNALVQEVGLQSHVSKQVSQLSGGNQRKLQFALALLDYRPVIFLDEPTTGMDPRARRDAWLCIQRAIADRGTSVVLTSHSMDECEALCHRLVIMVCGQLRCIGSVQYLKDKFGNQYTIKLKVSRSANATSSAALKAYVAQQLPGTVLVEEHANVLQLKTPAHGLRLSALFLFLTRLRQDFPVEDFSVSQTTLEHVFVNMAQMQELLQSGQNVLVGSDGQMLGIAPPTQMNDPQVSHTNDALPLIERV